MNRRKFVKIGTVASVGIPLANAWGSNFEILKVNTSNAGNDLS